MIETQLYFFFGNMGSRGHFIDLCFNRALFFGDILTNIFSPWFLFSFYCPKAALCLVPDCPYRDCETELLLVLELVLVAGGGVGV